MKIDQLRYFIYIVENGSFNKAAKKLYISQPALTASIHALEKELGVTLLFRTNKGILLTEIGQQIYLDCKDIINLLNEKVDYWKNYSSIAKDPAGTVFFAAIPAICTYLLNNVFFTLESVFPKINVSLFDIDMLDFPRLLRNSNAKMGLNAVSLYQDEQAQVIYQYRKYGLNYQAVADDKYCIAISTKGDWAQHDAISKESLNQKRYISYCMKNNTSVAESMFKNLGHYPNSSNILYLNSISSILQAVSDNKGYTSFLQCVFFNNVYVRNKLIRTVNLSDSSATPIVHHLVWADESSLSPAESAILHYLLDNYTAMFENAASSIK